MPFPRNPDFVGRTDDLDRLHAVLQARQPVGIRPAGLTGMGGIGKTQLAVEYVYRHQADYPGGIFWVNAAEPLVQGLAQVGSRLRPDTIEQSPNHQLRAVFEELNRRPDTLIVLDNLDDPAQLDRPVGLGVAPSTLACCILFTTRLRNLSRFRLVEVSVLPDEPALQLLLRNDSRRAIRDDPNHPERPEARSICRLLGGLPLALELASAFLAEWPDIPLADYRKRLQEEGCLSTLDDEAANLAAVNFQPIHAAAVAATLKTQWDALKPEDDEPRLLFRVAGQFAEAAAISVATLGLFAGVSPAQRPGYPSPLMRALKRLHDVRLVEELLGDRVRLHPLVREFAAALTPPAETAEFRHACARRVARAFEDISAWEAFARSDGIEGLERCLTVGLQFALHTADSVDENLASMLRLVRREAHHLREGGPERPPNAFAQQVHFRAVTLGEAALARNVENQVAERAKPGLLLRWRTINESPALVRLLTGHQSHVNSVAVSPDGRYIVSGSWDRTVAVWDLDSGSLIHQLSGHRDRVWSVVVSPDGRHIVSGSLDGTVAVWDLESGALIRQLDSRKAGVWAVAVTPDSRRIVSGSGNNILRVWDLESGALIRRIPGHGEEIWALAVSPDGRRIVAGSRDLSVAVWDLESGALIQRLSGHYDYVQTVGVSPDGRRIASGASTYVMVWDPESGTLVHELCGHKAKVASVAFSPDGRNIVSGSWDRTVAVWDLESGARIHQLSGHEDAVSSVAVSPDGRRIISGSHDKTVAVWDLGSVARTHPLPGHRSAVTSVVVSPDGRCVISASEDYTVAIREFESGTRTDELSGFEYWVTSVAVSPDGRFILSGSWDHTVAVWDLESGKLIHRLSGHRDVVSSVAATPDGRRIVSGSWDKTVTVWDLESGALIHRLAGHREAVSSVAVSPDGRFIVSGSADKTVAVWDLERGACILQFDGHASGVSSVAVSADGRFIVSGSWDETVAVWDLESGALIHQRSGHRKGVTSVAVSSDCRRIVSGYEDSTVAVWDLKSGQYLASLTLDGVIRIVAWHLDSHSILAGDAHGNLYRLEYREQ